MAMARESIQGKSLASPWQCDWRALHAHFQQESSSAYPPGREKSGAVDKRDRDNRYKSASLAVSVDRNVRVMRLDLGEFGNRASLAL